MFLPQNSPLIASAPMPPTGTTLAAGASDEAERVMERADELNDEASRIDLDECDWSGKAWKLREEAAEMRRKAEAAAQISDAVLAIVLNWDDALGLAYRLSPHYETHPEKERLANAIWRRAQERHQLDKDERTWPPR